MHVELVQMLSPDKLVDHKEQQKYLKHLETHRNGDEVQDGDVLWMIEAHERVKSAFYNSSPDFQDELIDDSLIHELDKLSQDFNQTLDCFGFDVPSYNNAFLPYESKLAELLAKRIQNLRGKLSVDRRETATAIALHLDSRVQLVYGHTPFSALRVPMLTPTTFRAMAETLMRFPDAITEVGR